MQGAALTGDRVQETATTTGTADMALAGAPAGFVTFLAGIGDGKYCHYAIVHRTLPEWEIGLGGVVTSGTILQRTTVLKSSNAGAKVNFSAGTKDVFVTAPSILLDQIPLATNQGRLVVESATLLAFRPYNGRHLPVKTTTGWRNRDIGAGIVSGNPASAVNRVNGVANQALAADTTYLVTVFDDAGVLTFDFLTSLAHQVDTNTGVEIRQADDSHVVVGMVRTNAASQFPGGLLVLSWANRRGKVGAGAFTADRATGSLTYVELHTEIRVPFLTWGDDVVGFHYNGTSNNTAGRAYNTAAVAVDGTSPVTNLENLGVNNTAGDAQNEVVSGRAAIAEGYHYATLIGRVNSGTGTWHSTSTVTSARTALMVGVQG
jgi:hypothetical protein